MKFLPARDSQSVRHSLRSSGFTPDILHAKQRLRLPGAGLLAAGVLMLTSFARPVHAECLGLSPPPPADLNICRQLVEDLVIPPVVTLEPYCKVSGWWRCLAAPHCCTPGVCLLSPECVGMRQVEQVAGYVVHAGDLYCGVQELAPEQLLADFIADRFPDPGVLTLGGPLVSVASAYVDGLECRAAELSPALVDALNVVMAAPGFNEAFTSLDVSQARIIAHRDSGALDLPRGGWGATTVGSLIFLPDDLYDALYSWTADTRCLSESERVELSTIAHELTHVRQYRELGRERFLNEYLVEALKDGYSSIGFEEEAYALEDRLASAWPNLSLSACPSVGVPIMTGPNAPSGRVERSGVYSSAYEGWRAFDADPNSQWISNVYVSSATIGYHWPSGGQTIRRYALNFVNGSLRTRAPKDWTFEGNNGGTWVVLDVRRGETNWGGVERREYTVANPGRYSGYRLNFTDDNAPSPGIVVISLGGIEFLP